MTLILCFLNNFLVLVFRLLEWIPYIVMSFLLSKPSVSSWFIFLSFPFQHLADCLIFWRNTFLRQQGSATKKKN